MLGAVTNKFWTKKKQTNTKQNKHTQGGQILNKITKLICVGIVIKLNGFLLGCKGPEFVEDEDGNLLGIRLHLPQELIADCEHKRWQFINFEKKFVLEEKLSTEEKFHEWCLSQEYFKNFDLIIGRTYALMFKIANEKNYLIPGSFCKQVNLGNILIYIHRRGAIDWNYSTSNNPIEIYLDKLKGTIESYSK